VETAPPLTAADVARGVCRLFRQRGAAAITEFVLGSGRRVDVATLDASGGLAHVEIKVSKADLLGDRKWPEYLDYCDALYFAVPHGFDVTLLESPALRPDLTGLIVTDGLEAAILRVAAKGNLNAARRKAETIRFALKAAGRLHGLLDPLDALTSGL
jgi:hypothetical protein